MPGSKAHSMSVEPAGEQHNHAESGGDRDGNTKDAGLECVGLLQHALRAEGRVAGHDQAIFQMRRSPTGSSALYSARAFASSQRVW